MQVKAPEVNHIDELLAIVVAFTGMRRQVLANNLSKMDTPGFSPQDLAVDEFSEVIDSAISEYLVHERIILFDTDTIRFGPDMALELKSVSDPQARVLLHNDRQGYVEYQTKSLVENALNEKVALELLETRELLPYANQTPMGTDLSGEP